MRDATLVAQPFDASARQLTGEARPIAENVFTFRIQRRLAFPSTPSRRRARSCIGPARWPIGSRASSPGSAATASRWQLLAELGRYNQVKLSPDVDEGGRRAAPSSRRVSTPTSGSPILPPRRARSSPSAAAPNVQPVWSPDGRHIAWVGRRGEDALLYRKPADGSGGEEVLYRYAKNTVNIQMSDWSSAPRADARVCAWRRRLRAAGRAWFGRIAPARSRSCRLLPRSSARLCRRTAGGSSTSPTRAAGRRSTCSRSSSDARVPQSARGRRKWMVSAADARTGRWRADVGS